jgi:V/A-type H+-transporting ATPase subunit K
MTSSKAATTVAVFLTIFTALIATAALLLGSSTLAAEATAAVAPEVISWGMMAAAIAAGLSAVGAAYAVAHVGSAAVGALAEKPELLGRVLILVGLAEGIAIYGLIVAILILNRIG